MIQKLLLIGFLLHAPLLAAQESAEPPPPPPPEADIPEPPPLPPKKEQRDLPPPSVTIRREDGKTVEEYSINGNVYMVRVTPKNAPPYMLVDMDGDGQLEKSDSEVGPHILPPHWVLFEWD